MWVTSGTEPWARNQVSLELVGKADVICVMEEAHLRFLHDRYESGAESHPASITPAPRSTYSHLLAPDDSHHPIRPTLLCQTSLSSWAHASIRQEACEP
jgi:hypothetical protein